ncbi:MAG: hypothetical protein Q4D16_14570 [Eubacteriales bacterium]|nr:hypothetical protein [Eubacteriales bacterium]
MKKRCYKIKWYGVNELDLLTIESMWRDGYRFCINDGKIQRLMLVTKQQV